MKKLVFSCLCLGFFGSSVTNAYGVTSGVLGLNGFATAITCSARNVNQGHPVDATDVLIGSRANEGSSVVILSRNQIRAMYPLSLKNAYGRFSADIIAKDLDSQSFFKQGSIDISFNGNLGAGYLTGSSEEYVLGSFALENCHH